MPDPLPEEEEIRVQNLKNDLVSVARAYAEEEMKARGRGDKKDYHKNLTKEESEGLASLQKRDDVVIFQTDKSGRFSVDTRDGYIEATMPHVVGDGIVEEAAHLRAQKEINAHATLWVRMLSAGEKASTKGSSGLQRVKDSMQVHNHGYAPVYSLRKDHKEVQDEVKGPPTRPVCGGSAAYNNKMSHFMGLILRPVWQECETVCQSSEELLAAVRELNESGKLDERCTVGSADVKALYPSLDIDFTSEKVAEMFVESAVSVNENSVDKKELGLYLALNRTPGELQELGLQQYCQKRKFKKGKPVITGAAVKEDLKDRYKPWHPPELVPDEHTTKKMLAEALKIAVSFTMKNHIYCFNGESRRQEKGGPIGLGLTGDVAQIFMAWWDKQLIKKLEEKGMRVLLYKRYVDDIILVVKNTVATECGRPRDESNMLIVQETANNIHTSIEVTFDCPSMHEDVKMPVLDLKVWPTQEVDPVTRESTVRIMHEHYSKEVASKAVVHARSALPWKTKRTIHTQEVIRILRNCSEHLPANVTRTHVSDYVARMQYCGYTRDFRAEVVESAMKAFDSMLEKDANGTEPLYRPREWKKVERARKRRSRRTEWFRGGGKEKKESVIFVPATPGGELKRRYEKVIEEADVKIGVTEVPGTSLKMKLQVSDPFKKKKCESEDCIVCVEGDGGRCRTDGVVYKVTCKGCDETYIGQSSKNAYTRGKEHVGTVSVRGSQAQSQTDDGQSQVAPSSQTRGRPRRQTGGTQSQVPLSQLSGIIKKPQPKPTLKAHVDEKHAGEPPKFKMEVVKMHGGDALLRQISEAVQIRETKGQMNRQEEWRQIQLPRLGLS